MERLWVPERRIVHGYLSVDELDEAHVDTWAMNITDFSAKAGYTLGTIFIDRGVSAGGFARRGFIEMLSALRLPGAYAAVVPSLAQLSTDTFLQQVLTQMVRMTGSQLLVTSTRTGESDLELTAKRGAAS